MLLLIGLQSVQHLYHLSAGLKCLVYPVIAVFPSIYFDTPSPYHKTIHFPYIYQKVYISHTLILSTANTAMRYISTVFFSALSVATIASAYADPNQRDRDLFERELQRRNILTRDLIERGLYEREILDRRMFEHELALRDLYPTRTLNIPRAITSAEVQNDVMGRPDQSLLYQTNG